MNDSKPCPVCGRLMSTGPHIKHIKHIKKGKRK